MMKEIDCQEPWFSKIRDGLKTIEGRKFSYKYASLKTGEILKFQCNDKSFLTEVVRVVPYKTLEDYLTTEGLEKVLPGIKSMQDAVELYLGFYDKDTLDKDGGFLAIHIKVLA